MRRNGSFRGQTGNSRSPRFGSGAAEWVRGSTHAFPREPEKVLAFLNAVGYNTG